MIPAGFGLLALPGSPLPAPTGLGIFLGERQVRFDPLHVGVMNDGRFRELPFALGVFGRHKVTARGMGAQHFPGAGDLEPLGDRLLRFDTFGASHKFNFVTKERAL